MKPQKERLCRKTVPNFVRVKVLTGNDLNSLKRNSPVEFKEVKISDPFGREILFNLFVNRGKWVMVIQRESKKGKGDRDKRNMFCPAVKLHYLDAALKKLPAYIGIKEIVVELNIVLFCFCVVESVKDKSEGLPVLSNP
jgi:hypothetical protein